VLLTTSADLVLFPHCQTAACRLPTVVQDGLTGVRFGEISEILRCFDTAVLVES